MKNLVLGAAVGYTAQQLNNFVRSFRRFNTVDDIVFMVDAPTRAALVNSFNEYDVNYVYFNHADYGAPPHNARFFAQLEYLIQNPIYRYVLLPDTRDVVFQSDPFANLPDEFVHCYEEDSGVALGSEPYNSHWIRTTYGQDRLNQIVNSRIVCSGVILGSHGRMVGLIESMVAHMKATGDLYRSMYVDQCVLNQIANSDVMIGLGLDRVPNGNHVGTVGMTVTRTPEQGVRDVVTITTDHVEVLGRIPPIIHQYDRSPAMAALFDQLYRK